MSVFKLLRIVLLLSVFFVILIGTWMNERRLANWERPVWVTVYPIVGDNLQSSLDHAESIDEDSFEDINRFFERSLLLYGVNLTPPIIFQVAPVSLELPPPIPDRYGKIAIAFWSLQMRWWVWRKDREDDLTTSDIQLFVMYHSSFEENEMNVSVGMRKGMYGLVKAYAGENMRGRNQIVIAHELLHVLGASDKYIYATGAPEYPYGYAAPNQIPLYPQSEAEIMGGRTPLNAFESVMPHSLEECQIGHKTAEEIGLLSVLLDN